VTTEADDDEQKHLQALLAWGKGVEKLHKRYFSDPPPLHAGSQILSDDAALRPYHMSHEVSQRLSVAVDCLDGLRVMTIDAQGFPVILRTFAPYPLLRSAIENACAVAWLLEPVDEFTRVTRRFELWARSHDARNDVEKIVKANADKKSPAHDPRGWSRDTDFIERMRVAGVPKVDKILRDPKRNTTSTTRMVDAGAAALAKGSRGAYESHHYAVTWRALSGASHGDLWALMSLPDRDIVGEPDPETDRVGARVYMTASKMALWTDVATKAVKRAIGMYDRSRLVLADHAADPSPRVSAP
jgi:hypothetical protein